MLMKMNKILQKQRGISLLEVMLSLAIIAIILLLATRYYVVASKSASLNATTALIGSIQQGAAQYRVGQGSYANMTQTTLINQGSIAKTDQTSDGTGIVTEWGAVTVDGSAGTSYKITLDTLPFDVCTNLTNRYSTSATVSPGCTGGATTDLTITYPQ